MGRRLLRAARVVLLVAVPAGIAHSAPPVPDVATPPPPPAPYEDRLIDNGKLAPLPSEAEEAHYDSSGWSRSWRIEGFGSRVEEGGTVTYENGVVLNGSLDTPDYGTLTFDANVRGPSATGVYTLWQRGLPFDNGWRANNGAGMLNTPGIELSRQQFRFFMPTFPIAGAQTEWIQPGRFQFQASVGEPGVYDGLRLAGFSRLGGSLFTAGGQWNPDPHLQVGLQGIDAIGVGAGLDSNDPTASVDARSWYGALAWTSSDTHVQFNLMDSEVNQAHHDVGMWFDAEMSTGRYRHNFGAFRFGPDLAWGYSPVNRDLQGSYYRVSYASQQWTWSGGFDSTSSVSSLGANSLYGTGNLRYQVDTTLGVGGGASVRHSGTNAGEVYGFVDKLSSLGTTRVQVDVVDAEAAQHSKQVTIDHTWPTAVGLRLSTTLSLGVEKTPDAPQLRRVGFAANGSIDLTADLSLEGSVHWTQDRDSTQRTVGRYANLGLVWRISQQWSLIASYYDNRSTVTDLSFAGIAPVVPLPLVPVVPRDRAIFVTVRYEDRAGTPAVPLGGLPGGGAGTITGTIYYDNNENGLRDAGESGAANVTVVLDGRFGARTDADGRFTFPMVAAGPHVVVVIPDNLALSYNVSNQGRREVVVSTREVSSVDIGATRTR
ncbi:MAG TPA: SdrD B-like domain-containing protein [Usitatibacter sp.]|nr:SdrD B-like domain-containing protein [Usitatibacter sp.]